MALAGGTSGESVGRSKTSIATSAAVVQITLRFFADAVAGETGLRTSFRITALLAAVLDHYAGVGWIPRGAIRWRLHLYFQIGTRIEFQ